jgi:hypothetical protein
MKLLLEGSLMALVLVSELVGLVALAKDRASTETHLPANRSFTIISASGAMVIISWWCGTAPPAVCGRARGWLTLGRTVPRAKVVASTAKRGTVGECKSGRTWPPRGT